MKRSTNSPTYWNPENPTKFVVDENGNLVCKRVTKGAWNHMSGRQMITNRLKRINARGSYQQLLGEIGSLKQMRNLSEVIRARIERYRSINQHVSSRSMMKAKAAQRITENGVLLTSSGMMFRITTPKQSDLETDHE